MTAFKAETTVPLLVHPQGLSVAIIVANLVQAQHPTSKWLILAFVSTDTLHASTAKKSAPQGLLVSRKVTE